MSSKAFDICVSGSGAVAKALALALAGDGWRVALAGQFDSGAEAAPDVRTYALNARAIALLERLRIWPQLKASSTQVDAMQIRGDGRGALAFSAWQQCVPELAWIVDAAVLERLLGEALRYAPRVDVVPPLSSAGVAPVQADLLAICEGKHSGTRAALGVEFDRTDYGHWGVAARLTATQPHRGVARQWFRSPDILALLPFHDPVPGASYGLVWSLPKARAEALLALPPDEFVMALQQAMAEADPAGAVEVGSLCLSSSVAAWPLALAKAQRWHGPGWVLVGDAAHQVHPLSGQGLNLGFADVDTLSTVLAEARRSEPWRSAGDDRLLRRYVRRRALPTQTMQALTDSLLNLFADDRQPVKELRNTGMTLLDRVPAVKRWLVSRALDA